MRARHCDYKTVMKKVAITKCLKATILESYNYWMLHTKALQDNLKIKKIKIIRPLTQSTRTGQKHNMKKGSIESYVSIDVLLLEMPASTGAPIPASIFGGFVQH